MVLYLYLAILSGLAPLMGRPPHSTYGETMLLYLKAAAVSVMITLFYGSPLNPLHQNKILETLPVVFVAAQVGGVLFIFKRFGYSGYLWCRAIVFAVFGSIPLIGLVMFVKAMAQAFIH